MNDLIISFLMVLVAFPLGIALSTILDYIASYSATISDVKIFRKYVVNKEWVKLRELGIYTILINETLDGYLCINNDLNYFCYSATPNSEATSAIFTNKKWSYAHKKLNKQLQDKFHVFVEEAERRVFS